jgi:hypothetical protein
MLARVNNAPGDARNFLPHRPTIAVNLLKVKADGARLDKNSFDDEGILQGHWVETLSAVAQTSEAILGRRR